MTHVKAEILLEIDATDLDAADTLAVDITNGLESWFGARGIRSDEAKAQAVLTAASVEAVAERRERAA